MPILIAAYGNRLIPLIMSAPDKAFLRINNMSWESVCVFVIRVFSHVATDDPYYEAKAVFMTDEGLAK